MKITFLLCALLFSISNIHSQLNNRFGIGISTDSNSGLTLSYGQVLNESNYLNLRFTFGDDNRHSTNERQIMILETPNGMESELIETHYDNYKESFKLAIGPEFQIKESPFTWAAEGILGVRKDMDRLFNRVSLIDEDGFVSQNHPVTELSGRFDQLEQIDRMYVTSGIQGRVALNATLTKKMDIQVFASTSLEFDYNYKTVDLTNVEAPTLTSESRNYLSLYGRLGVTLFLHRG